MPYNFYLDKMYQAHININMCGSVQADKIVIAI